MSIFGAMNIAYSGLVVDRKWLDAVADNIDPIDVVERIVAMVPAPTPVWNDQQRQQRHAQHSHQPGRL